jgi:EpsI family protein
MMASTYQLPEFSVNKSILVGIILLLSGLSAWVLTPEQAEVQDAPDFEAIIPDQFGEWKRVPDLFIQAGLTADKNDEINVLYDRVLMRTYTNEKGDQVMLALAYATEQKQDIKIHRPEVCYVAQGYQLLEMKTNTINPHQSTDIPAQRLLLRNQNRAEAVTYWIRIGDEYPIGGIAQRMKILRDGLKGKVVDGILVRASTVLGDETESAPAYAQHEKFLADLLSSLPGEKQMLLAAK